MRSTFTGGELQAYSVKGKPEGWWETREAGARQPAAQDAVSCASLSEFTVSSGP
jgi:hypothetical protein